MFTQLTTWHDVKSQLVLRQRARETQGSRYGHLVENQPELWKMIGMLYFIINELYEFV